MSEARDGSRPVREEDAFDVEAVAAWLDRGPITEVRQFPGGASNLTYLLRMAEGPDLILRRPPAGTKAKGAHDMGREFRIQAALEPVFGQVPEQGLPGAHRGIGDHPVYKTHPHTGLVHSPVTVLIRRPADLPGGDVGDEQA